MPFALLKHALASEPPAPYFPPRPDELKPGYDVVIVGAGGSGVSVSAGDSGFGVSVGVLISGAAVTGGFSSAGGGVVTCGVGVSGVGGNIAGIPKIRARISANPPRIPKTSLLENPDCLPSGAGFTGGGALGLVSLSSFSF